MKKYLTALLVMLCVGPLFANDAPKPAAEPATVPPTIESLKEENAALIKERDALKGELTAVRVTLENTKKESQAFIQSFQEQVQNLSNQLATSQTNLKLAVMALNESKKAKP